MRRRLSISVALALLAGVAIASAAFGAGNPHSSTVQIRNSFLDEQTGDFIATGDVGSSTKKCIAGRKVKVFYEAPSSSKFHQVDTARTSANGDWAASGPLGDGVSVIKAVLVPSKYGPKHHRKTCGGDTDIKPLA
jgi:hypothetical protein